VNSALDLIYTLTSSRCVPGPLPVTIRAITNSAASSHKHLSKGIQINLRCHQQLSLISITFKQFIFMCILISVINRQQMLSCIVISVIPCVWRNCASRLYLVPLISEGKASNRMLISCPDLKKQSGTHKLRTQRCPSTKAFYALLFGYELLTMLSLL